MGFIDSVVPMGSVDSGIPMGSVGSVDSGIPIRDLWDLWILGFLWDL